MSVIRRLLPVLSIVWFGAACDNIEWGGIDVAVIPPPPRASAAPEAAVDAEAQRLPEGPVLFYVSRPAGQGTGTMVPIFEIGQDSLRQLRAERDQERYANRFVADFMRQGAEFVLFSRGVRAGQLVIQSAQPVPAGPCGPLPQAVGSLELAAGTDSITEFLALSSLNAPQIARRLDQDIRPTRTMETVVQYRAEAALRARGAQLPGSWQRAMAQVVAFPVSGAQSPGLAATFLVGDTLGPGLDNEGYSLFFIAAPAAAQVGWDTVYVEFNNYPSTGKIAPRVIDHLDWDRDDQVELLLRVYTIDDAWFEAVGRDRTGNWRRTFRDRCERSAEPAEQPAEPPGSDSAAASPDTARD